MSGQHTAGRHFRHATRARGRPGPPVSPRDGPPAEKSRSSSHTKDLIQGDDSPSVREGSPPSHKGDKCPSKETMRPPSPFQLYEVAEGVDVNLEGGNVKDVKNCRKQALNPAHHGRFILAKDFGVKHIVENFPAIT